METDERFPFSDMVTNFGLKVYRTLKQDEENLYFSPLCLHCSLVILYQGAVSNTHTELQNVLNLPERDVMANKYKDLLTSMLNEHFLQVFLQTKIYIQENYTIKDKFKRIIEKSFFSTIKSINFVNNITAADSINQWIFQSTNKEIHDTVTATDFDNYTHMVVISAAYFVGPWLHKFCRLYTRLERFHISTFETVQCHMMHMRAMFPYAYSKELQSKAILIPFRNRHFKLMVIMPVAVDGMTHLERTMEHVSYRDLIDCMKPFDLILSLPKFKIENKIDFTDPLKQLGLLNMYHDIAEFDHIAVPFQCLQVNKIIQKSSIAINEIGAGSSKIECLGKTYPRRCFTGDDSSRYFKVIHPFMIALLLEYNDQHVPLFIGKVYKPLC